MKTIIWHPKKNTELFFASWYSGFWPFLRFGSFDGRFQRRREGYYLPLVRIKEDETFENALRRFKRKCEKSGILSELKKRQHFEKPSAKRKRKMLAARKKSLKRLVQERRMMS
jgi:small subunit ribosomal protein S21